jgi:hypothetical protein
MSFDSGEKVIVPSDDLIYMEELLALFLFKCCHLYIEELLILIILCAMNSRRL